jgi:hypothetical protein
MGVSSLQCHTAIVSGFVVLKLLNIETYLYTEFASVYISGNYLESVLIRGSELCEKVELSGFEPHMLRILICFNCI